MTYRPLCVTCLRLLTHPGRSGWGGQLVAEWTRPEGGRRQLVARGLRDLARLVDVVQEYREMPEAVLTVVGFDGVPAGVLADVVTRGESTCRWHIPM